MVSRQMPSIYNGLLHSLAFSCVPFFSLAYHNAYYNVICLVAELNFN